jgi:hypothetical protein
LPDGGDYDVVTIVMRSGIEHRRAQCRTCGTIYDPGGLRNADYPDAPIVYDRSWEVRCERCGVEGAELHHYAPRHLFGMHEAERYATGYLCRHAIDAGTTS